MELSQDAKLYETIVSYIKSEIDKGAYKPGDRLPTERELAQSFGVSRITSKRALDELQSTGVILRKQGSGSFVAPRPPREEQRTRAMPDLSDVVALILPYDTLGGRFYEILTTATDTLARSGYHLTMFNSCAVAENERALINRARGDGTRGILLYPTVDTTNIDLLYDMWLNHFPLVLLDKRITDIPISNVCADNVNGAYSLAAHMLNMGHRRIGCFFNVRIEEVSSVRHRYFGFCKAMKEYGAPIDYRYIVNGHGRDLPDSAVEERIRLIMKTIPRLLDDGITALIAENDYVALEIYKACEGLGVRIPEDLSLTGFDNLPQCTFSKPTITSCEQNFSMIGTLAAELLLAQIDHGDFSYREHNIETKLYVRKSVRALQAD